LPSREADTERVGEELTMSAGGASAAEPATGEIPTSAVVVTRRRERRPMRRRCVGFFCAGMVVRP
jgi:hypothetical protein